MASWAPGTLLVRAFLVPSVAAMPLATCHLPSVGRLALPVRLRACCHSVANVRACSCSCGNHVHVHAVLLDDQGGHYRYTDVVVDLW